MVLLFDIDGTLTYPGQNPSAATVEAIRKVRSNGHKAFLSTGRTFDFVPPAVAEIGFDGGIFSAGARIVMDETILEQHFMPDNCVAEVIRFLQKNGAFFILETSDGRICSDNGELLLSQIDMNGVSEEMQHFTRNFLLDTTAMPYSTYRGQPIHKIAYYSADPAITQKLVDELGKVVNVVPFNNIPGFPLANGELSDPSITKGRAAAELCQHLGVTARDCIAYGDSMNDAEIIQFAGLGIAMGNAVDELKELADMTCDCCENDGIAKTLQALNLI